MKNSLFKDLIFIVVLALGIGVVDNYLKSYNYDLDSIAKHLDEKYHFDKNVVDVNTGDVTNKVPSQSETTNETNQETTVKDYSGRVIYIHGLGNYSPSDLQVIKQGIEEFYGFKCVISNDISTNGELYDNNTGNLMAYRVLMMGNNYGSKYDMYVTDEPLCVNDENSGLISGHARLNSNTSVVSTVQMKNNNHYSSLSLVHSATHELAHNLGLDHCDNQNCLMKSHGLDTKELCENCKNKIKL